MRSIAGTMVEGTSEMYATILQGIGGIHSELCVCMLLWNDENALFEAGKTAISGFKDIFGFNAVDA
jgi:hypothetical protein